METGNDKQVWKEKEEKRWHRIKKLETATYAVCQWKNGLSYGPGIAPAHSNVVSMAVLNKMACSGWEVFEFTTFPWLPDTLPLMHLYMGRRWVPQEAHHANSP